MDNVRVSAATMMSAGRDSCDNYNDVYHHSMNEGFVRKRGCGYLNPNKATILTTEADSSISDIFGSVKMDTRDVSGVEVQVSANVFGLSHLVRQETLGDAGDANEESETSQLKQNNVHVESVDGDGVMTKKESVYI